MNGQAYTAEFRVEAVKLVTEQAMSHRDAARRLGIPMGTLSNWVQSSRRGVAVAVAVGPGSQGVTGLQAENARLRKELARVEMEREIVKKAAAYFARESLQGTRS